jgi:hypothetical protein
MKPVEHLGTRKGNISKTKLMSLKLIIKPEVLEICRGINEFKKRDQPRINIIKDENGNLLADPQSVLNR